MKLKILCICQGGNVRSATLAYLFKYKYGLDSLAASWQRNSKETLDYLCEWADIVIVVEKSFTSYVSEKYKEKLKVYDIGPDRWGISLHPELQEILDQMIMKDKDFEVING